MGAIYAMENKCGGGRSPWSSLNAAPCPALLQFVPVKAFDSCNRNRRNLHKLRP